MEIRPIGRRISGHIPPVPLTTVVGRLCGVTAITRLWAPGDTRRCLLCCECAADHAHNLCMVTTTSHVPPGTAWDYDCSDRPMLRPDGTTARPLTLRILGADDAEGPRR